MRTSSPRNALAFLGDKLQARRDASFLEEYRKQEHASLQKEVFYNIEDDAEILAKQQKITSVIKYDNQSPGGRSSFSTSAQLLYYSPVNPSAEHGRSSNSPRRRQNDLLSQEDMAVADATLSPKSYRRSRLGATSTFDKTIGSATTRSFIGTPANADRAIDRALSLSATARFSAAMTPVVERAGNGTEGSHTTASVSFAAAANADAGDAAGRTQRGKRLSDLLQAGDPVTPRRQGNATVRFSDEASNENPYSNGTPPSRQMPRIPSAQQYPSSRWRSNFLTSSTSPMDLSADSTARTDSSTESAPSQQAVLSAVLPDEASPGSSIGSESDSDAKSESGSDCGSDSGSETSSNAPGTASTAGQVSTSDAASAVGLQTSSHAVAALYSSAGNSLEAGAPVSSSGQQSQQAQQGQQAQQMQQAIAGLADRCLRPLSKLQQADFLPGGGRRSSYSRQSSQIAGVVAGGSRSNNTSRQSSQTGLVWQNSGWTVPFDPSLVQRQQASPALPAVPFEQQSKLITSLSWHATSLDEAERVSATGDAALQCGAAGKAAGNNSNQLAGTAGTAATAGTAGSAGIAVPIDDASSNQAACTADRAGAMTQDQLLGANGLQSQGGIPILQQQDLQQQSLVQLATTGETRHSGQDEPQQPAKHAKHGISKKSGSRIRKHSRHGEDAALAHIEDHLQVLKHVHLKKASPRTLLHNRARAEQLGFAALPDTLEGSQPAATLSALHPVTGQDTWYRAGIHVLPEALNAAVLEALAAETAGLPTTKAQTGPPRPNTSPSASWLMRMEAGVKMMVYDEKLDSPAAGKQRIPAINPNRAYLKSLAQGSAKKHFQSVEVDLRESHRRLLATQAALQPVTYANRQRSISS